MKFIVWIQETVTDGFTVEAKNEEEALEIAQEKYRKGEFVLEPGELLEKQICAVSPDGKCTDWQEF